MVVYQAVEKDDVRVSLNLTKEDKNDRTLKNLPPELNNLIPCYLKKNETAKYDPLPTKSNSCIELADVKHFKLNDMVWLILKYLECSTESLNDTVPTWSGYNSLVVKNHLQKVTRVCLLPMLYEPPTNKSVQLTFMKKLENINEQISDKTKVIVTLDMGLYKPVKQLSLTKPELSKNWILRPGELHILMAELRAIGTYMEGTGIPDIWTSIFSDSVISQILRGKHVRRAISAHISTLSALYCLYFEELFRQNPELNVLKEKKYFDANDSFKQNHDEMISVLKNLNFLEKIAIFNKKLDNKPTFKMIWQYIEMVETLLQQIRAIRTGDWNLHLSSLESFVKYFFALDLHNYSSMISWHLNEIKQLEGTAIWNEFLDGNWVINQNNIPFSCLGTDEALEHKNKLFKILGGMVGITQNPEARNKFCLAHSELERISWSNHLRMSKSSDTPKHHDLFGAVSAKTTHHIESIKNSFKSAINPFTCESDDMLNIYTGAVLLSDIKDDVCNLNEIGLKTYQEFQEKRINSNAANLFDPIKKLKLHLCKDANKKVITKKDNCIKELKVDRSLFSRLLVVCRSRTDINLKDIIGRYELSSVPRSLFSIDGSMHMHSDKSKLMHALEEAAASEENVKTDDNGRNVVIIDAIAELHVTQKLKTTQTCLQFSDYFQQCLWAKYSKYDEIHLIFDRYDKKSLKQSTRNRRYEKSKQFHIEDSANVSGITMRDLLSHGQTKNDLSEYLSQNILKSERFKEKKVTCSWGEVCYNNNNQYLENLASNQEEADTKMILHAIYVSKQSTSFITVVSPDTDVLVLLIKYWENIRCQLLFQTGTGTKRRTVNISNIAEVLTPLQRNALPALHAISGCDVTGGFFKKGKLTFWKAFKDATDSMLSSLRDLGNLDIGVNEIMDQIEAFICRVYYPKTNLLSLSELRWWCFSKHQMESNQLPPTKLSLLPASKRARLQTCIWNNAHKKVIPFLNPEEFGWIKEEDCFAPVPSECPNVAPDEILNLISCSCKKSNCRTKKCKCATNNLQCTEICLCADEIGENMRAGAETEDEAEI